MMDGNGWGLGGLALMIVWFVLICGMIFLAARLFSAHRHGSSDQLSPLDIAKERYAKGEIKKDEFDQIKATLS
ncbi:SHOCT domain-containing protein [Candidatus Saccharibacteria bacterium]|nr:SHOCT domain-containing protein [Candidatus Saccharibacteria bacterium]